MQPICAEVLLNPNQSINQSIMTAVDGYSASLLLSCLFGEQNLAASSTYCDLDSTIGDTVSSVSDQVSILSEYFVCLFVPLKLDKSEREDENRQRLDLIWK